MPWPYGINDDISIESSTYSHEFEDFLMYVVQRWVHIFIIDLILIRCWMLLYNMNAIWKHVVTMWP
jgi:hypothetical protein